MDRRKRARSTERSGCRVTKRRVDSLELDEDAITQTPIFGSTFYPPITFDGRASSIARRWFGDAERAQLFRGAERLSPQNEAFLSQFDEEDSRPAAAVWSRTEKQHARANNKRPRAMSNTNPPASHIVSPTPPLMDEFVEHDSLWDDDSAVPQSTNSFCFPPTFGALKRTSCSPSTLDSSSCYTFDEESNDEEDMEQDDPLYYHRRSSLSRSSPPPVPTTSPAVGQRSFDPSSFSMQCQQQLCFDGSAHKTVIL